MCFYARKIAGRQKVQYNEGCRDDTPFFEFRVRRKLSPGEDRKEEIWEDQKSENTFSECYLGGSSYTGGAFRAGTTVHGAFKNGT